MIKTNPPDSEWLKIGVERGFTLDSGNQEHLPLKKILLGIGGWGVCIHQEPDLEKIVKRGLRFPARSKSMRGQPNQCHSNSAFCWDENRDLCTICTGYALSRDGMWRQHSWVWTHDHVVLQARLVDQAPPARPQDGQARPTRRRGREARVPPRTEGTVHDPPTSQGMG